MSDEWKAPSSSSSNDDQKSWKLLERTLQAGIQEQRRARRWGIFFKLLTFTYLFVVLAVLLPAFELGDSAVETSHTAVIDVRGVIADEEAASADNIIGALREAFEDEGTRGIVLRINSPGGSPVQSGYIYDEIRRLRGEHPDIKVYAVVTDLGASGAYYVASAADEIYANKSSLVGSIGVTAATFGFVEAMDKLGVERRVYTSGEHKAFLDPFQPQKPEETQFWQNVLETTHRQFIEAVKQGRGERLQFEQHPELFSGLVWSGEQALELGLVDGLASTGEVARRIIGAPETVDFTIKGSPLERLSKELGASVADRLAMWMGLSGPTLK
ncbi:signal peptide peptidase SppA [Stutzerimonas urumqiensis]|uniref:signal peptide peptidase SppA n=1 Tax=Stutzerimonas urumqiensis TaxID=638269 RepID=UPI003BA9E016